MVAMENPYRYTGRRFDDETGLYHNRARYYDPDLARFVSQDPLGLGAGINPYAYAGNDPVNAADPSGLCPMQRASASVEDPFGPESISTTWTEDTGLCSGRGSWGLGATMMFGPKSMGRTKAIGQRGVSFGDLQGAEAQMPNVGRPDVSLPQADTMEAGDTAEDDENDGDIGFIIEQDSLSCTGASVLTYAADRGLSLGLVSGVAFGSIGGMGGLSVGTVGGPPVQIPSGVVGAVAGWALGSVGGFIRGFEGGVVSGAARACILQ